MFGEDRVNLILSLGNKQDEIPFELDKSLLKQGIEFYPHIRI